MNGDGQPVSIGNLDVFRRENSFEQKNRLGPAEFAYADGFVQVEQADSVGCFQPRINPFDAMTIGVRLHHGPDARARSPALGEFEIVPDGVRVNFGENWAWHGGAK